MRCYCSSLPDCPPNGEIECEDGVSHCILSIRYNSHRNQSVKSFFGCWIWSDASRCPTERGVCNILRQSRENSQSCCCKGNLCNNSSSLQMVEINDSFWSNATTLTEIREDESVLSHHSFLYFVLTPILICTFFLILGIILCQFHQRRLRATLFKQVLSSSGQNGLCRCEAIPLKADGVPGSSINRCTCGYMESLKQNGGLDASFGYHPPGLVPSLPKVGPGWLVQDEIEGLASKITKLELKSQGCFGQVWHGRFVHSAEKTKASSSTTSIQTVSRIGDDTTKVGDPNTSSTEVVDVAVKIFRSAQKESWKTELSLFRLPGLTHPNILKFYGADQVNDDEGPVSDVQYWLITEYHPLGSLYDYLRENMISWIELLRVAVSVARGLTHLHSETTLTSGTDATVGYPKLSVAHRDLNSRNVLLKSDLTACIADFGLAIQFEPGQFPSVAHPQLGTRRYMAPEVLDGAIQFSRDAYLRIDVYAMGLVFWELMSRCTGTAQYPIQVTEPYRAPFELELGPAPTMGELQLYVAHEKQRPKFHPSWNANPNMCTLWETVEECWDQDAEARLSAGCVAKRLAALIEQAAVGVTLPVAPHILSKSRPIPPHEDELSTLSEHHDIDRDRFIIGQQRMPGVFGPRSLGRPQPTPATVCLPIPSKCASDVIPLPGHLTVTLLNGICDRDEKDTLLSQNQSTLSD